MEDESKESLKSCDVESRKETDTVSKETKAGTRKTTKSQIVYDKIKKK